MAKQPNFNTLINDGLITHGVDLNRVAANEAQQMRNFLSLLDDDLKNQIQKADVAGAARTATKIRRQEALIRQADDTIRSRYTSAKRRLDSSLLQLADIQGKAVPKLMNDVFKVDIVNPLIDKGTLRHLVSGQDIMGRPAKAYWKRQGANASDAFAGQMRLGVVAGETNDQLVRRIVGTSTGKRVKVEFKNKTRLVHERAGGIMDTSKRNADSLVRTSVQQVSNDVNMKMFEDNKDILSGVEAVVTFDQRTTDLCISRSGGAWDFDGKPLKDSATDEPFPGPPPWHFQCRTTLSPVVMDWSEMTKDPEVKKTLEKVPRTKSFKASMDGKIAEDLTYEQWLKTKPVQFQKDVLGVGKQKLWSEGKITAQQLVNENGRPLTLSELSQKHGIPDAGSKTVAKSVQKTGPRFLDDDAPRIADSDIDTDIDVTEDLGKLVGKDSQIKVPLEQYQDDSVAYSKAKLSKDERLTVERFYENTSGTLNDKLRTGEFGTNYFDDFSGASFEIDVDDEIARLNGILRKAPKTPKDQLVYRYMEELPPGLGATADGEVLAVRGYSSTAVVPQSYFASNSSTGVEIFIRKGSKRVLSGFNRNELEVLLPDNAVFRKLGTKRVSVQFGDEGASLTKQMDIVQLEYLGVQ